VPADGLDPSASAAPIRAGRTATDVQAAVLATLTGFGIGMVIAWLSGAI
jgi:hypothetical protein